MPKCETIVANQPGGSGGVPAEAAALFFGGLFDEGQGFGTPVLAAGGEERVDERDGRDIGSAEGCGFNRGEKDLVAFAGKGGEIGVCDADAIGAVRLGLLRAFDGMADLSLHSGRTGGGLHRIERGCEGDGKVVEVALEIPIAGEAKTPDNADDRRRIGLKTLSNGTDAEKDILAGMFEDRANDLLALGAQLVDALRKIRNGGYAAGILPGHRARGFPKSYSLSTPRPSRGMHQVP